MLVEDLIKQHANLYSQRHGGPYDRGIADSYYRRGFTPHYYVGDTYSSTRIDMVDMSANEIAAYTAGFGDNELLGSYKEQIAREANDVIERAESRFRLVQQYKMLLSIEIAKYSTGNLLKMAYLYPYESRISSLQKRAEQRA